MNKDKVMLIAYEDFTIIGLLSFLEQYTMNNGTYPDFIDMPEKNVKRYMALLRAPLYADENNLTFHGIKIRKI